MVHAVFVFLQVRFQGLQELFVGVLPALLPGDEPADIGAQAADALGMEPGLGFAHGEDDHGIGILRAALGVGIEVAHRVQLVAEEFGTEGPVSGGGVDVHDAAPDSELAGTLDHAAAGVACMGQLFEQFLQGILLTDFQREGGPGQHGGGDGPLGEGLPGEDLELRPAVHQREKLIQPLLLPGPADHGGVVQGQLPAGQHRGRLAQECGQLLLEPLGGHVVLADDHDGPLKLPAQSGDQVAPVDLAEAGNSGGLIAADGFQQKLIFRDLFEESKQFFHIVTSSDRRRTNVGRGLAPAIDFVSKNKIDLPIGKKVQK